MPAAISAPFCSQAAASFLRLVEFDEFSFLHRLGIELGERFFVIAGGHFSMLPLTSLLFYFYSKFFFDKLERFCLSDSMGLANFSWP